MQNRYQVITNRRFVRKLIVMAKRLTLPGLDGVPIYNVLGLFVKAVNEGVIGQRAAAISYNFFIALFPGILALFTLIPYIPIENFQRELMSMIELALPDATGDSVLEVINDIITRPSGGILSLGFVLALLFSSNGFKSIIIAFNSSIHIKKDRSFLSLQWTSLVLVLVFSFTMIITIAAILLNEIVLGYLVEYEIIKQNVIYYLIMVGNWVLLLAMIFFMVSFLYYFAPKWEKRFRLISAGSTVATVIIVLFIFLFNVYINNFGRYNVLYGSIGTLLIVLLWIYINAFILLLGFEINTSIVEAKNRQQNKT